MTWTLVFDTETTGLPLRGARENELEKWSGCRLVQIAWELFKDDKRESAECYTIIPDGYTIPESASKIHGITTEMASRDGKSMFYALMKFHYALSKADVLVAHNIEFDYKLVAAEYFRLLGRVPDKLQQVRQVCTMKRWTKPGGRWPKLGVLYTELFGRPAENCHQADTDVRYCAEIYFHRTPA